MKKKLSILIAFVMAITLLLTPVAVSAAPGSYTTDMGSLDWGATLFDMTDESGLNWGPLEVDVSYADGQATFVITPPVAFRPGWPNDNFWLVFDTDNDGVEDLQVLYNAGVQENPALYPWMSPDFHWATKTYDLNWSDYQVIPEDWVVSAASGLDQFTVSIPVSYLGGVNSDYGFLIGLVKYVHMDAWQLAGLPPHDFDPSGLGWSTGASIFVPLPSEGWESETIPANTVVGLNAGLDQIVAIDVSPTSIDFGTITPGTASDPVVISIKNIGTVTVDVDAQLGAALGPQGVFQYLRLGGARSTTGNWWLDIFPSSLDPSVTKPKTAILDVPATYSALGSETDTLFFIATSAN